MVSFEQRVLATIAALLMVAAVIIGFSQRSVTLAGGAAYSCGSGFVHDDKTWKLDSQGLHAKPTPVSACPSKIYKYRNLAIALGVLGVLSAVIVFGLGDSSSVSGRTQYVPPTPHPLH